MHQFRKLAALSLAAGTLAACTDTVESPLGAGALSPEGIRIAATTYSGTPTCTGGILTASDGDTLRGQVTIPSGCTFTVNPADANADGKVTIFGDASVNPSALVISQGARIRSVGSASVPIVFTPTGGSTTPGAWGGIVLIGSAQTNDATATVEGLPGSISYGGANDTSSIGDIKYTRIEYAGYQLVTDNELNGLSMYGVGCSPADTLDYIQVHRGSDDGFEFFGGCADLKHAVATGNEDDSFDFAYGWRGRGQYWIALQSTGVGDKGIEADNDDAGTSAATTGALTTNPTIFNITLVGRDASIADSTSVNAGNWGIQLRRQVQATIRSSVVLGFDRACDGTGSSTHVVSNSIFFARAGTLNCTTANIRTTNPGLFAPYTRGAAVDFRPSTAASAAATQAFSPVPTAPAVAGARSNFFDQTSYVGAAPVRSAATAWYAGWTNWSF